MRLLVIACVSLAAVGADISGKVASKFSRVTFQAGVNGYDGTVDVELWALAPTTILDTNPNATTDANNDGGESQILLRFEGIVGDGPHQIPSGSAVHSAALSATSPRISKSLAAAHKAVTLLLAAQADDPGNAALDRAVKETRQPIGLLERKQVALSRDRGSSTGDR